MGKDVKLGIGVALVVFVVLFGFWLTRPSDEEATVPDTPEENTGLDLQRRAAQDDFTTAEQLQQMEVMRVESPDPEDNELELVLESPPVPPIAENAEPQVPVTVEETRRSSESVVAGRSSSRSLGDTRLDVVRDTGPQPTTYVVQEGDTLWSIAENFYGAGHRWQMIADANPEVVGPGNQIRKGAVLVIPSTESSAETARLVEVSPPPRPRSDGATYVIKRGDTLYSIAREHYGDGRLWQVIHQANQTVIPDPNNLPVGAELVLPPRPAGGN